MERAKQIYLTTLGQNPIFGMPVSPGVRRKNGEAEHHNRARIFTNRWHTVSTSRSPAAPHPHTPPRRLGGQSGLLRHQALLT